MDYITVVGLVAAALTVSSLFPQIIKALKTKLTRDISLGYAILLSSGSLLWFAYGVLDKNLPIIVANFISFIQTLILIMLKITYK
jgi:MtN3 and saliva related transmembrane protein